MYELTNKDEALLDCALGLMNNGMECSDCILNSWEDCVSRIFKDDVRELLTKMKIMDKKWRMLKMNEDCYKVYDNKEISQIIVEIKFDANIERSAFVPVAKYDYEFSEGEVYLCYAEERKFYKKYNTWKKAVERKFKLFIPDDIKEGEEIK